MAPNLMPQATTDSPRDDRLRIVLGVLLILLIAIVTLPGLYHPLGPVGLDPGWQWAINHARDAGLIFGRDIVFPYGPLGFLMYPLDVSSNLLVANLFLLGVQALFAYSLVALFIHTRRLLPLATFGVLFLCAHHQGLALEGGLLLVVGMLTLLALITASRLPLAASAALAAVLLLVKLSLGVASMIILIGGFFVGYFLFRATRSLALGALALPLVLVVLAAFLFDQPSSFFRWLYLSADVVSGYSIANSLIGPGSQVAMGVITVACWLCAAVVLKNDKSLLACNLVFAPVVLIQFRLAFVRQDAHEVQFIPFMLALIAISSLFAHRPRQVGAHVAAFAALLTAGALTGLADPVGRGLLPANLLSGGSGPPALSQLLHIRATQEVLAAESEVNLEPLLLTDDWREILADSRNGVGTLPWEILYCPANGFDWNPAPTLQLYCAYTQDLDLWSAAHYSGDSAPGFIINELLPVGKRHQMLDAPATWRTVFVNYRLQPDWLKAGYGGALLEHRSQPRDVNFVEIGRATLDLEGTGFPVPESEHLLFAHIDLRLNLFGRLQKMLFRVPPIFLMMHYASGHTVSHRLIPGTAINGVLINRFPRDYTGYLRLWQGIIDDPVVRLAVTGDGTSFFLPRAAVTWRELRIASPTPQSVEGPWQETPAKSNPAPPESP